MALHKTSIQNMIPKSRQIRTSTRLWREDVHQARAGRDGWFSWQSESFGASSERVGQFDLLFQKVNPFGGLDAREVGLEQLFLIALDGEAPASSVRTSVLKFLSGIVR
jgi:hypothetical protein